MRKNVLIFSHSYPTQFIDVNNQYTKMFDPNKFEVTVAYLRGKEDEEIRRRHLAENVLFLDPPKWIVRGLKLSVIYKMLALHKAKNFQVVICHRYKPTFVMLCVSLFKKIPVLFSVMHELGTLISLTRKIMVALLAKKNIIFAGVSNAVRDDLRKHLWKIPQERIITLYNMIDTDLTEPQLFTRELARKKLTLSDQDFVFGNIGRLAKNKDQTTLIAAFAKIKTQCPRAKLLIIGNGQLESTLKQQVNELNLTQDVIFTGFVNNIFEYIKAIDVYISSSIQEAFGRVLLEAMIAKIPVIATAVNGVPEVIGDAGVLLEAANPNLLAEKMLQAYQTPFSTLQFQGEQGYTRVMEYFSLHCFQKIFWQYLPAGIS